MIDLIDTPASWVGHHVTVTRTGMTVTGRLVSTRSSVEDITRMRDSALKVVRETFRVAVSIVLTTLEGPLRFDDIERGSYNIELLEQS